MEKDLGSWLYHLQSDGQFLNSNNVPSSAFGPQRPNGLHANGYLSGYPYSGFPQSKVSQLIEQFGWSYCLPRFRQAFTSMQNKTALQRENVKESVDPDHPVTLQQKRFLVFDQSGNQTTLMFGNPAPYLPTLNVKPDKVYVPEKMNKGIGVNTPHLTDEHQKDNDAESEMREDTDEINALLYSDNDSDCDYYEEEEMSTGHSPIMEKETFDVMDTASSGKRKRCLEEDEDEDARTTDIRSKQEKIREKVSILQKIIPGSGSKSKNAMVVLDEAISYLKALQCKAEAVGFPISPC